MRLSRRTIRQLDGKGAHASGELPINLVPMIDILTVLVLYLLIGAIATHLAVLQLNLPSNLQDTPPPDKEPLALSVTVREKSLEVAAGGSTLKRIPPLASGEPNLAALTALLVDVKQRAPLEESIALYLEPKVDYETLVKVMDAVRVRPPNPEDPLAGLALFPSISIGDAPVAAAAPVAPKA